MLKIEASTLEIAYSNAASQLECSITQLKIEVVQVPSSGFLGFFKKSAIIVAIRLEETQVEPKIPKATKKEIKTQTKSRQETPKHNESKKSESKKTPKPPKEKSVKKPKAQTVLNDTIMPASFVSDQDDEDDNLNGLDFTADYDDEFDERSEVEVEKEPEISTNLDSIVQEVQLKINALFKLTCFAIDSIDVSVYDNETLLIEFKGDDAALLIGKEGYRYKALSYMIFNWINSTYEVQLRLEIAEFLQNQEESIARYLINVYENVDRDGRAQTKILDGVLVQIALKELRAKYPGKYVVIRSTRDGLKYIIINDYNN
ncbi:Jag N-terminal domain-containing protein [Sulfurimonas sp. SAG-AH-194-C21]|nr:Jag N-terminal domain-containing protein [Sulfurimonas sp. SAG-AH-194-C21]MDF1882860.1 Jag N-terminal domain-containing protein [Sulfurimonas sp. SAG-AH-194-C21]